MSNLTHEKPHAWQVIRMSGELNGEVFPTIYKVLAGWNGGYLDGASWKLNSGITSYDKDEDYVYFKGSSGSVYQCALNNERMISIMSDTYNVLNERATKAGVEFIVVSFEQFLKEFNSGS